MGNSVSVQVMAVRRSLALGGLCGALLACAGPQPRPAEARPRLEPSASAAHDPPRRDTPAPAPASQGARPARTVGVRGITGSLSAFEVEQAMSTRGKELLACVEQRPRALAHVAGDIAFHVDLDGQGKVEGVTITQSEIGYAPLEDCLAAVVATAPFPVPAGAERTETQWRMSVDPLRKAAEPLDSTELVDTIARQAEDSYQSCEIGKGRRFLVTGYLGRARKLHPVTVRIPLLARAPEGALRSRANARAQDEASEPLTCLANSLQEWKHWPKGSGYAKVSFELRWVAKPRPTLNRARLRRRKV